MARSRAPLALPVALALLTACSGSPAPAPGGRPESYRVVYRVEAERTTEETVEVTPARSRRVTRADGRVVSGSVTTEDGVYVFANGAWRQVQASAPGDAGEAMLLRSALDAAERRDRARRDGTGEVAGRTCTWWVTAEPLDAGPFAVESKNSRTRSCVDAAGLLLADVWSLNGVEARTRTATSVATTADLSAPFGDTAPEPLDERLRLVVVAPRDTPVVEAPPGLVAEASAVLTEVGPEAPAQPLRRRVRTVFRGSGEVAVVEDVEAFPGPAEPGSGDDVTAGAKTGVLRCTYGGLVVEVRRANGHLLTVRTSLPEDAVLAWLARL